MSDVSPHSNRVEPDQSGNGRVPGSPGVDELRANAEMANVPSRTAVGETRRKLFGSDATSSDQIPRVAGIPSFHQGENEPNGAQNARNPSVRPHADFAAKAQEGFSAPTTRVAGIPSFHQGKNGPNGVQLSNFSSVRASADPTANSFDFDAGHAVA